MIRSLGDIASAVVVFALASSPRVGAQTPISIRAADGGTIAADSYGAGPHGVVLAHGGRFDRSSWKDLASQMAAIGFRIVAIDFRAAVDARAGQETPCLYDEHCLAKDVGAAMRYLRATGAKTISLVAPRWRCRRSGDDRRALERHRRRRPARTHVRQIARQDSGAQALSRCTL